MIKAAEDVVAGFLVSAKHSIKQNDVCMQGIQKRFSVLAQEPPASPSKASCVLVHQDKYWHLAPLLGALLEEEQLLQSLFSMPSPNTAFLSLGSV